MDRKNNSSNFGGNVFSHFVDKFNAKILAWNQKWLIVDQRKMIFYDKKPSNGQELMKPREWYSLDRATVKAHKDFKTKSITKKSYVIGIQLPSTGATKVNIDDYNYHIIISLKNESLMSKVYDTIIKETRPLIIETTFTSNKPKPSVINDSSDQKEISANMTNFQLFKKYRNDLKKKDERIHKDLCRIQNKSLSSNFLHESDQTDLHLNSINNYVVRATRDNPSKSTNISIHVPVESSQRNLTPIKGSSTGNISMVYPSRNSTRADVTDEILSIMKTKTQKEENTTLSQMINNMIVASSKKPSKCKSRSINLNLNLNNQSFETLSGIKSSNLNDPTDGDRSVTRRKHINKIIKLSLKKTGGELIPSQNIKNTRALNLNQSILEQNEPEGKPLNINLSQDDVSFEENDKSIEGIIGLSHNLGETTVQPQGLLGKSKIQGIIKKIENYEEYIFDSFIFKSMIKSHQLTKSEIGELYTQIVKEDIKNQILTEMIARLSKEFLTESVTKSLEHVLREKEMNKNFYVNPSHQHSIEYCIVDLFNTFVGNNKEADEFYTKVLPGYLNEKYQIDLLLKIKSRISIANLFVVMQYHNRVYFNDNVDVNFSDPAPIVTQDIKYISPFIVNKWYKSAMTSINSKGLDSQGDILGLSMTNVKRMKYPNFEMNEGTDMILNSLKKYDRLNDETRISVVKNIYFFIFTKKYELALKLCDFYVQKFTDSIFLNPFIYLILAEIYNETAGIDLARLFFEKSLNILNWLYPDQSSHFIVDVYYTFSLILLKQNDSFITDNIKEIESLLEKSKALCEKFYDDDNEKRIKISLEIIVVKLSYGGLLERHEEGIPTDEHVLGPSARLFKPYFDEVIRCLDILRERNQLKEEMIYLNLFIDIINGIQNADDDQKLCLLKRLHEVKKKCQNSKK